MKTGYTSSCTAVLTEACCSGMGEHSGWFAAIRVGMSRGGLLLHRFCSAKALHSLLCSAPAVLSGSFPEMYLSFEKNTSSSYVWKVSLAWNQSVSQVEYLASLILGLHPMAVHNDKPQTCIWLSFVLWITWKGNQRSA